MKHIKLLSLSTLIPTVVVPFITTSCNSIDENHLLSYCTVGGIGGYTPKKCQPQSEEFLYLKYSKGEHVFVIKEINKDWPVGELALLMDEEKSEDIISNGKVKLDDKDISDLWEKKDPSETENDIKLKDITQTISTGTLYFIITTTKDAEFAPIATTEFL